MIESSTPDYLTSDERLERFVRRWAAYLSNRDTTPPPRWEDCRCTTDPGLDIELIREDLVYRLMAGESKPVASRYLDPTRKAPSDLSLTSSQWRELVELEYQWVWERCFPEATQEVYTAVLRRTGAVEGLPLRLRWRCKGCDNQWLVPDPDRATDLTCEYEGCPKRNWKRTNLHPTWAQARDREIRVPERYTLLERLGAGGMGVVYSARDRELGRIVALKLIKPENLDNRSIQRFEAEARLVAALHGGSGSAAGYAHHIVAVFDVGTTPDGRPFLCMEFCGQGTLGDRLRSDAREGGNKMTPVDVAEIVRSLALAIHYAHEQDRPIIHRDLKPDNILFKHGTAKIADFGLARRIDDRSRQTAGIGTLRYMAPEQAKGLRLGIACDIYSLGAVLYHCLTGVPPFCDEEDVYTLLAEGARVEPLTRYDRTIPPDLEQVCLKCLQPDPPDRYGSAKEFADDLGRYLSGQPVKARPLTRWGRLVRWSGRNPSLAIAFTSVVFLAIVAGVIGIFGWRERGLRNDAVGAWAEADRQKAIAERKQVEAVTAEKELSIRRAVDQLEYGEVVWPVLRLAGVLDSPDVKAEVRRRAEIELVSALDSVHRLQALLPPDEEIKGQIRTMGFSPDGRVLALGGDDGKVRVFDWRQKNTLHKQLECRSSVASLAFSPDGGTLVAATDDGRLHAYETRTGHRRSLECNAHPLRPKQVVFSPDGSRILVAGSIGPVDPKDKGYAQVFDAASGEFLGKIDCKENLYAAVFSPDGTTIATGGMKQPVLLWDAKTYAPRGRALPHQGPVFCLAYSRNGDRLASGCVDGDVRLWTPSGDPVGPVLHNPRPPRSLSFDPTGRLLVTGTEATSARVWNVESGRPVGQELFHRSEARAAGFSPDGSHIVTAGFDGVAKVWAVAGTRSAVTVLPHPDEVMAIDFSPDGRTVVTGSRGGAAEPPAVRFWDAESGRPAARPDWKRRGEVWVTKFCCDGRAILVAGADGVVSLRDASSGDPRIPDSTPGNIIATAAFDSHRDEIAFGGYGKWVWTIPLPDGRDRRQFETPTSAWVWRVEYNPARDVGRHRLLTTGGKEVCLWDPSDLNSPPLKLPHVGETRFATFSPDGERVLTCSEDQTARVWSARDGRPLTPPLEHGGRVNCGVFARDDGIVVTGAADHTAAVWDVAAGKRLMTLPHERPVLAVAISPDDSVLATAGEDGLVQLWETRTGLPLAVHRHKGAVTRVMFSPGGKSLLSACRDGSARLWKPAVLQSEGAVPSPPRTGGAVPLIKAWTGMTVKKGASGNPDTLEALNRDEWEQLVPR